jgi:large subunit ribosomal protein L13
MKLTKSTKAEQITHEWHLVDVKGKVLGRVASDIAYKLMGKSKPYFVRNLDCGDYVVVVNANDYVVTGRKEQEKLYGNYSGFPGGLKQKALRQLRIEKPTEPIRHAVFGMLPKNKLRDRLITRLYVYVTGDHPYKSKFENKQVTK